MRHKWLALGAAAAWASSLPVSCSGTQPTAPMPPVTDCPKRQIFVVRHAHKLELSVGWHAFFAASPRPADGPLSPAGHVMAVDISQVFRQLTSAGLAIDQILVSPALRCLQTCMPTALALKLQMKVEPNLREFPIGAINGTPDWDRHMDLREERAALFPCLVDLGYQPILGEAEVESTMCDYTRRVVHSCGRLLSCTAPNETLLVVTHGITARIMIATICRLPMSSVPSIGMASVTRIVEMPDGQWRIDPGLAGSVGHLADQALTQGGGDAKHPLLAKVNQFFKSCDIDEEIATCSSE